MLLVASCYNPVTDHDIDAPSFSRSRDRRRDKRRRSASPAKEDSKEDTKETKADPEAQATYMQHTRSSPSQSRCAFMNTMIRIITFTIALEGAWVMSCEKYNIQCKC